MTKNIFSLTLLLLAALVLGSCKFEEDDLFTESAAERLNEASELYSSRLMAQPNGWAMQLYPTTDDEAPYGCGYLLLLRFNDDYSVDAAMNNSLTDDEYMEDQSAWEVITDDGPVLTFNTHNDVIHIFSDPDDLASTDDDETGTGMGGDYEWIIVEAPEDASYMMLKGKKRATYNLLTPVEEGVEYEDYLEDVRNFQSTMFPEDAPTYNLIYFGDSVYKMEDASEGIPNIYPYDQDAVLNESFNPFLVTKNGDDYYFRFRDEITVGDYSEQEFIYLPDEDIFQGTENTDVYMCGADPLEFFDDEYEDGTLFTLSSSSSDMSTEFATVYNNLASGFKSVSYTLSTITITTYQNTRVLCVAYKSGSRTSTSYYTLTYTKSDDGVSFSFEPFNTAAENVMNTVSALETFLNTLSQKFYVTPATTGFDLNTLKLTAADDENLWFVLGI